MRYKASRSKGLSLQSSPTCLGPRFPPVSGLRMRTFSLQNSKWHPCFSMCHLGQLQLPELPVLCKMRMVTPGVKEELDKITSYKAASTFLPTF